MIRKRIGLVVAGVLALILVGMGGAAAGSLITGNQLAGHTVTGNKIAWNTITQGNLANGSVGVHELNESAKKYIQSQAGWGPVGPAGAAGLDGSYYAISVYNTSDIHTGFVATTACLKSSDTAISGGVQDLASVPIGSSFPDHRGSGNPNNLNIWTVQFAGDFTATRESPTTFSVFALCVVGQSIDARVVYTEK